MSYYLITKLLGLDQFKIERFELGVDELIFYVTPRRKTADCPICHKRTKRVHQYLPPQTKRHINIGNRKTFLVIAKRRFYCSHCHRTFTESIKGIDKWQRHTFLLEDWLISMIALASFNKVTEQTGCSYRLQQRKLDKYIQNQQQDKNWWRLETEAKNGWILGLDGHSFAGLDMVQTITDLTSHRLLAVLEKDNQQALKQYLDETVPKAARKKIIAVCMDMTNGKRTIVKRYLPQADIVADPFHLIANANKHIDEERLAIQQIDKVKLPKTIFYINKENLSPSQKERLLHIFKRYPSLKTLWFYKEALRSMYREAANRHEAQQRLDKIIKGLYLQQTRDTSRWARTLERWYDPILNYFIYRTTNAYTEGLHTKFKLIKRISYGFRNKRSYINKITLACLIVSKHLPQFLQ